MADFCMKRSLSSHSSSEEPEEHLQAEGGGRREGAEEEEDYDVVSKPASPVSSTGQQQLLATLPESSSRRRSRSGVGLLTPSSGSGSRKPRGRPPGSKNKPKPPVYITRETEGAMKTQQLEIPAGCDVADMVQKFARKHRVGVHVVNGSGVVCNFSLLQPAISLKGTFNLLSLSGTFIGSSRPVTSSTSPSSAASAPWLAVFVSGNSGEVFGGTVVGKVVAASNVVLNVSTFGNYEFHRVDPGEYEDEEEQVVDDNSNRGRLPGKMEGCSVSTGVGFAAPAQHLNWPPPPSAAARPPPNHRGF